MPPHVFLKIIMSIIVKMDVVYQNISGDVIELFYIAQRKNHIHTEERFTSSEKEPQTEIQTNNFSLQHIAFVSTEEYQED